jgi:hypothetical protein
MGERTTSRSKGLLEDLKHALDALTAEGFRAEVWGDGNVILLEKKETADEKPRPYDVRTSDTLLVLPDGRHIHAHAGEGEGERGSCVVCI